MTFALRANTGKGWVRQDIRKTLSKTTQFRGEWATCADADGVAAMFLRARGIACTVVTIRRRVGA